MANPTLQIPITQAHIDKGVQGSAMACAFVLALQDASGESCNSGFVTCRVGREVYQLSLEAKQFVRDFDNRDSLPPKPVTVDVTLYALSYVPN